jgi:hypothetical protein
MAVLGVFGAFSFMACAHRESVRAHTPAATAPVITVEEAARPPVQSPAPPKADDEKTTVLKTWLSREEVEVAREAEQQHARETQTFWAMRKDRESLRPTNIGPGGTCVCFGGDPLCSCR